MRGSIPTVREILKITHGSLTTIGPLRDEWWQSIAKQYRDGRFIDTLPSDVASQFLSVWQLARAHADADMDLERARLAAKAESDARLIESAVQLAGHDRQALADARDELRQARSSNGESGTNSKERGLGGESVVTALTNQLELLNIQSLVTGQAHAAERQRFEEERTRLIQELDERRRDLTTLRTLNTEYLGRIAELMAEIRRGTSPHEK